MRLPVAPPIYNRESEQEMRKRIEVEDVLNYKKGRDIDLARGERIILHSPDGTGWVPTIDNAGVVTWTAI